MFRETPLLLLLFLLPLTQGCNRRCKFSRCFNGPGFKAEVMPVQSTPQLLRAQGQKWLPYICRRSKGRTYRLSSVVTGEAYVKPLNKRRKKYMKISRYTPRGIDYRFPEDYFHLRKYRRGEWVIGRRKTFGNQEEYLDDLCVTLPIRYYSYHKGRWYKGGHRDCIAFKTKTAKMLIELRWNSRDDLDLSVEEPDGRVASRFKQHRACGSLHSDVGARSGVCNIVPDKIETIRYFNCLPRGRFVIRVGHYRNCGRGAKYEVRVTRFGKLVYSKVGFSRRKSGSSIEEIVLKL